MPHTSKRYSSTDDLLGWDPADLREINCTPAGYLAAVATRQGARWERAFDHALDVLESFGTSRRIRPADATMLCEQMRTWASEQPTVP